MSYSYRTAFCAVKDFQTDVLGIPSCKPRMLNLPEFQQQMVYLQEEKDEIFEAYMLGDIAGVADGLADLIFYAYGMAHRMGLPFDDIWTVVVAANMMKVKGVTKRGYQDDAAKPEGWKDPIGVIQRLIRDASDR